MVNYGSSLQRARRDTWKHAYLDYDSLKEQIEELELLFAEAARRSIILEQHGLLRMFTDKGKLFLHAANMEIEKVSLFCLKRQGDLANSVGAMRFSDGMNKPDHHLGDERQLFDKQDMEDMFNDVDSLVNDDDPVLAFAILGVELLHLLRFICINAMAIRKIFKKYDKVVSKCRQLAWSSQQHDAIVHGPAVANDVDWIETVSQGSPGPDVLTHQSDTHLQQLANSAAIAALNSSLLEAMADIHNAARADGNPIDMFSCSTSYLRFRCVLGTIERLREHAEIVNEPFTNYLSRKAMVVAGFGGIEGKTLEALKILLSFDPATLLEMSRNELLDVMHRLELTEATPSLNRTRFLSTEASVLKEKVEARDGWGGVDKASLLINLFSALLYTINYYIVAPTANRYAISLGMDGAFGATLVGASSLSAIGSAFLYSFWYSKFSFKSALIVSALFPLVGNILYSLAISYQSMKMALIGRAICGLGSAEVVNRQLISACVSFTQMTRASALFVAFSAVGMSIGPFLAAILDIASGRDFNVDIKLPFTPVGGIVYNHVTSPGYCMAFLWLIQFLATWFLFTEPRRINLRSTDSNRDLKPEFDSEAETENDKRLGNFLDSILTKSIDKSNPSRNHSETMDETAGLIDGGSQVVDGRFGDSKAQGWVQSVASEISTTFSLLVTNPALPITFILFGYIELVDEVLISSCAMICRRYFDWNGATAGFIISSLGALVLPADFLVERASHRYEERQIMKYAMVFILCGLLAILNYEGMFYDIVGYVDEVVEEDDNHPLEPEEVNIGGVTVDHILNADKEFPYDWIAGPYVYVTFLSAIFIGTIVLEAVDTSTMAKATPPALNETFLNSGLLATVVGTLGRVLADTMLTVSALLDIHVFVDFVNATFVPLLVLAGGGYALIRLFYKHFAL